MSDGYAIERHQDLSRSWLGMAKFDGTGFWIMCYWRKSDGVDWGYIWGC